MARYDINHSKTKKVMDKAEKLLQLGKPPVVIPRHKLDAAHLRVKKAENKNKYFISVIVILLVTLFIKMIKS